jgi:hypothetical protein
MLACTPCRAIDGSYEVDFTGDLEGEGDFYLSYNLGLPGSLFFDGETSRRELWKRGYVLMDPPDGERIYEPSDRSPQRTTIEIEDSFCPNRSISGVTQSANQGKWSSLDLYTYEGYRMFIEGTARGRRRFSGDWTLEHFSRVEGGGTEELGVYEGTFSGLRTGE